MTTEEPHSTSLRKRKGSTNEDGGLLWSDNNTRRRYKNAVSRAQIIRSAFVGADYN
jgi:hypothetical protein